MDKLINVSFAAEKDGAVKREGDVFYIAPNVETAKNYKKDLLNKGHWNVTSITAQEIVPKRVKTTDKEKYYIERMGSEGFFTKRKKTYYDSAAKAQEQIEKEFNELIKELYVDDKAIKISGLETYAYIGAEDKYWSWCIRRKSICDCNGSVEDIIEDLERAEEGLIQYSYDLQDTYCCSEHLQRAIEKLKKILRKQK